MRKTRKHKAYYARTPPSPRTKNTKTKNYYYKWPKVYNRRKAISARALRFLHCGLLNNKMICCHPFELARLCWYFGEWWAGWAEVDGEKWDDKRVVGHKKWASERKMQLDEEREREREQRANKRQIKAETKNFWEKLPENII